MSQPRHETKIAPNIYRVTRADGTVHGWRVYVSRAGTLKPKRFPPDATLEQLQAFVDAFKAESDRLREERRAQAQAHRGTFAADAARYLALRAVRAMPSYADRVFQINRWVKAFGTRPRSTITARDIDEQLQTYIDLGLSGSTVNKLRTALMSLYTRLDGRAAANPVRDTKTFEEAEEEPRGQPYALLWQIVDAIPDRARPIKGVKGVKPSPSKARIEIMLCTGMTPEQVGRLQEGRDFSIAEGWYMSPRRKKGHKRSRFPRPRVKKPMTAQAREAFRRFVAIKAQGPFDRRGLRHVWLRAVARLEKQLKKKLPRIRLYDLRHSFGTTLFERTGNLGLVGEMLDHANPRTTRRYALGAVPTVLQGAMQQFEDATARGKAGEGLTNPKTPVHRRRQAPTRAKRSRRPSGRKRAKKRRK